MSLRIRQVKPAFWSDAKLLRLPLDVRLLYVGLWMVADDDGWFERDVEQIAVELHMREAFVRKATAALVACERVVEHECGHSVIPHLAEHQRLSVESRRVRTVHREHLNRECPNVLRGIVWNGLESGGPSKGNGTSSSYEEGNVTGGYGGDAAASAASVETTDKSATTKKKSLAPELADAPWNRRVAAGAKS